MLDNEKLTIFCFWFLFKFDRFISYGEHKSLGRELWETPFGEVIEGMEHVEEFYSYGKTTT